MDVSNPRIGQMASVLNEIQKSVDIQIVGVVARDEMKKQCTAGSDLFSQSCFPFT